MLKAVLTLKDVTISPKEDSLFTLAIIVLVKSIANSALKSWTFIMFSVHDIGFVNSMVFSLAVDITSPWCGLKY